MDNYEIELRACELVERKHYEEAYHLLIPLADKNSGYALFALGWMHENGAFVDKDTKLAQSYYQRAIDLGYLKAYIWLGLLLSETGSKIEARGIFEKGAEKGNLGCMNAIGRMLYEGIGGPADANAGKVWLERAANQGHILAQRRLLSIEFKGSRSIFTKISVLSRIIALGVEGGKERWRNPHSERLI